MLLNTFPFLIFCIFVFILYWKISVKFQWVLLLLASYYFIGSWKPEFILYIVVTTLINYGCAFLISGSQHKKTALALTLFWNIGTLFVFKYFNFFSETLSQFFRLEQIHVSLPVFQILAPIGISFYTFQTIGYIADVYRGKYKPEKHLGYFALFLSFFPQLSAGPIARADELLPQLKKLRTFNYPQAVSGLKLFTFGLLKKMVIADNLAVIVDRIFNNLPQYQGFSLVFAIVLFSWQIYMDFSGYTDMARGIARIFGIELTINFNFPYAAGSIRDFWRRWHISLSRWLKDYIYIPLGGNRKGYIRTGLHTLIVFTVCGFWHGASWNFLLWGILHGLAVAGERIVTHFTAVRIRIPRYIGLVYTYSIVCISWVFFRANTLSDTTYILRHSIVGIRNFINPGYILASISQIFNTNFWEFFIISTLLLMAIVLEVTHNAHALTGWIKKQHVIVRMIFYTTVILIIVHLRNADIKQFIYVRF